jgi:replicative DNA helicase
MINVLFFSIAGKKSNEKINDILFDLYNQPYIKRNDKLTLEYTIKASEQGNYPSRDYYLDFYEEGRVIKSLSEIRLYVNDMKDFYKKESMIDKLMKSINESNTTKQLQENIESIISSDAEADDEEDEDDGPIVYSDFDTLPKNAGMMTGIQEIDNATNGFQPGTVAGVCAFTSHGKSLACLSMAYKNVKLGKKGLLMSLEVHPSIIWMQLYARYLFEEHNVEINSQELINRTLTEEKERSIKQYEEGFKEMMKNFIIWDESKISKKVMMSDKLLRKVIKKAETKLGGLDFVIWDHVTQFDLMYDGDDVGNKCIKTIQMVTKTYKNQSDLPLVTIMAVQVNRKGKEKADKQEGRYSLNAISDNNEVERTCSYCMFLYTNEDMRMNQETKVTLMKNRLGQLVVEPVVTTFNPIVVVVGDLISKVEYQDDFSDFSSGGFDDFGADDPFD